MIIKKCDCCFREFDKMRRFEIKEVDPVYGYAITSSTDFRKSTVKTKQAALDLCPTCAEEMGFDEGAMIPEDRSVEDVLRDFIECIVGDHSHEEG